MATLRETGRKIGEDVVKNSVACDGSVEEDPTYNSEIKIKPYPGSETDGGESGSGE